MKNCSFDTHFYFKKLIVRYSTHIEYEYWNDKFPHVDKALYDRIGFQSYLCPKNSDFFIRANYNSEFYEFIQISLSKWSGSNCKSDDEINDVINSHYIDIGIVSTYFDFNDYTDPVKYRIRRCLFSLNDQNFPKFMRGLDKSDFYFSKFFQNVITFLPKEQPRVVILLQHSI